MMCDGEHKSSVKVFIFKTILTFIFSLYFDLNYDYGSDVVAVKNM